MKSLILVISTLIIPVLAGGATVGQYIEDFSKTQYRDATNTTALWDTTAGEIKLPPFGPTLLGSYATSGEALAVAVAGDYLYVACGASGLQVLDISNTASPTLTGAYDTQGVARDVDVEGVYAYVADDTSGIHVIDISDPANPTLVGSYLTDIALHGVDVTGNYAYVAGMGGLRIIDVSEPENPTQTTGSSIFNATDIKVCGRYVYYLDQGGHGYSWGGFLVAEVISPTHWGLRGWYITPGEPHRFDIAGNNAFVADGSSGLRIINFSDPNNPTPVGSIDTPGSAVDVAVAGDYAYVADDAAGLQVIDITSLSNPVLLYSYSASASAKGITLSGGTACLADGTFGFKAVRVALPTTPLPIGSYPSSGRRVATAIAGDYLLTAEFDVPGAQVFDVSIPSSPNPIGSIVLDSVRRVEVSGTYAYFAELNFGLRIVDLGDPWSPVYVGGYSATGTQYALAVDGKFAYLAGTSGLWKIDISDPTNPILVNSSALTGYDMCVSGDLLYCADYFNVRFWIVDVDTWTVVYNGGMPANPHGVVVEGDLAYLAIGTAGLRVMDVSEPSFPTIISDYDTDFAYDLAIAGDIAYLADGDAGIMAFDITDPANPSLFGTYDTPGRAVGLTLSGDQLFVSDEDSGLQIFDVSQRQFASNQSVATSLSLDSSDDPIVDVKLTATQNDMVSWEVSADGGGAWLHVNPDAQWHTLPNPGSDLIWRSTLKYSGYGSNPTCSHLEIDWRHKYPLIRSVEDVPNDQGGKSTVYWKASGLDVESEQTITHYSVWRATKELPPELATAPVSAIVKPADVTNGFAGPGYRPNRSEAGGYYWEWLANVGAYQFEGYAYTAETLYDSTAAGPAWHYFQVLAHTANHFEFWTSPLDSGYSVDNLAPAAPQSVAGEYNYGPKRLTLWWERNTEPDLAKYYVYRGEGFDFVPSDLNRIATTPDTTVSGFDYFPVDPWHIKVSAVDIHGNESSFAVLPPEYVSVGTMVTAHACVWDQNAVRVSWVLRDDTGSVEFTVSRKTGDDGAYEPFEYGIAKTDKEFCFRDSSVGRGQLVSYRVTILENGDVVGMFETSITTPAVELTLYQNYPNPFNPATTITFSLPTMSQASLTIYAPDGKLVKRLVSEVLTAGHQEYTWNGTDSRGNPASSGIYFYRLEVGGRILSKKMLLLK